MSFHSIKPNSKEQKSRQPTKTEKSRLGANPKSKEKHKNFTENKLERHRGTQAGTLIKHQELTQD